MQPPDFLDKLMALYERLSKRHCINLDDVEVYEVINYLLENGVLHRGLNRELCVKSRVKFALELIRLGSDVERVALSLDWRDFEELISECLIMNNYLIIKNLRFGVKRNEVDVIGVNTASSIAVVVDCKHWSPGYSKKGKLISVCREHRRKVEELSSQCSSLMGTYLQLAKAKYLIPVVVTLTDVIRGYFNGVFIVPIYRFNDYIVNINYYVELLGRSELVRNKCFS